MSTLLRQHAEQQFAEELHELKKNETNPIPENWEMSPQSVVTYLMGGILKNGFEVSPKYIGNRRLMEIAVATLVTDRALLLIGEPGTAKSWLSEHLCVAINGDSTKVIQGTAGTSEESIRYSWNYAMLIAKGPSEEALVKSPLLHAMESGSLVRFEEISRCASEVQDALISILSEKRISVPEAFLAVDAILNIYENVASGLVVHEKVIEKHVLEELPFMASENIMMQAVEKGGNRQELHERLRQHAIAAGKQVKEEGLPNDMVDRIAADPAFGLTREEIVAGLVPENFVGRAPQQVEEFIDRKSVV